MTSQTNTLTRTRKKTVRLSRKRDDLDRRIRARVEVMLAAGLVGEVEGLLAKGLARNPSAARAVGYRETIAWLRTPGPMEELADSIAANTRRLVRKQLTWYRSQLGPHRVIDLQEAGVPDPSSLFAAGSDGGGSMLIP